MVKVEGVDQFLYNDDELAEYIKVEDTEPKEDARARTKDKKNGKEKGAEKDSETAKKEAAPEPKLRGPQYIEFYEAREIEKIVEKIEKFGVDIEDYDIEESEEAAKKAKKDTKTLEKPKYIIRAEKEKHQFQSLKEILRYVMHAGKEGMSIQRYKGLGEMNPHQLWETTMDPEKRTLLRVALEDAVEAEAMFTTLMGDQVEPRREFIEKHAHEVKVLDI
jgi:DNA gyrase subunit B